MGRKKTHVEYVKEVELINPNIEVIGTYVGAHVKIKHYCKSHNIYWDAQPTNILNGQGCKNCAKEKLSKFKTKTHEEYTKDVSVISPHIIVKESYIDAKTPILHQCVIHNVKWKTAPQNIMQGHSCPKCRKQAQIKGCQKTHEQYVKELKNINSNICVVGQYIGANIPLLHKCLIDNYEWNAKPSNILGGTGCPKCSKRYKRTHVEYVQELHNIFPYIDVLEKFVGLRTKIKHRCNIHDIEWFAYPCNLLHGHGCQKCGNEKTKEKLTKSHVEYINELHKINSNIQVMEKYRGANIPILHKCLIDGYKWITSPANILFGKRCPKCAGNIKKTHEEYVGEVSIVNNNIEVLEQYINARTPILHKCLIDNYEWRALPYSILRGHGCPKCNESKGERQIRQWLENNHIKYEFQYIFDDCCDKKPLPFDFYLPKFNQCIEYDGGQHYFPVDFSGEGIKHAEEQFQKIQHHDNIKNEYCKNNGISLLRIPYFKNIEEELNNFLFI